MQTREFRAMNTSVILALEGEGNSDEGLRQTQAFIEECEQRFSRFLPASEVCRLNDHAGQWCEASTELIDILVLSKAYFHETGGLFDPSVLPDLKRAGYDRSMDDIRIAGDRQMDPGPRKPRRAFAAIELDTRRGQVRLPEGMEIDLGGIAKGWIVQEAAQRLEIYGTAAAVSAGGDMFFAGTPVEGNWHVELEDPADERRTVAALQVSDGAVVTSSITKRSWSQNGQIRHHIIDPRTGEPAQPEWASVTVIAPRADLGEAYAKALLIGGKKEAARILPRRPGVAAIFVGIDGRIWASANAKEYLNGRTEHIK